MVLSYPILKEENNIVFITGGNSGIGKACALEAAFEGAKIAFAVLALVDHDETKRELTVKVSWFWEPNLL